MNMETRQRIEAVAAGHICVDLIPDLGRVRPEKPEDFFTPGKLVVSGPVKVSTGGPVSNTGLNLIKLGVPAALMGKIGKDPFGGMIRRLLAEEWGVTEGMIVDRQARTSYTVVLSPAGHDRMFLHDPGANDTFCAGDVDYGLVSQARIFHFGYPPLMRRMVEDDGAELKKIFRRAHETGTATSLDMALPEPESAAGQADWRGILKEVLPFADIFLPSAEEMLLMLDRDRFLQRRKQNRGDLLPSFTGSDLHRLSDTLLDLGGKIICIKCGHRGCYVRTAGTDKLSEIKKAPPGDMDNFASREFWHPAFRVDEPPNATGAGDASIAGFLASYLRGMTLDACVERAAAAGSANVRQPDALSGVPSWEKLNEALAAGWETGPLEVKGGGWRPDPSNPRRWLGPAERV